MANNVNAQTWLNEKYPINGVCKRDNDLENKGKTRKGITSLDLRKGKVGNGVFSSNKNLIEDLKLAGFTNLRKLIISSHQLTSLDVSDCPNLEELDCRGNELTSLNLTGCSNLKKIDCSNSTLRELDLTTCTKLEEVNVNGCPVELTEEETVKSTLFYDAENNKWVRRQDQTKSDPQVTKTKENEIRNILIVGITGNGKSALANTLSGTSATNKFEEGDSSTSQTKNFQAVEFEWEKDGQKIKYRLIDNIGFGDTNNISNEDILFEIGKGINSTKEGINQVLFVFKGRFGPEQVIAYNLFKDFIAESGITKFTTLVRTNFDNFRSQKKCQEDKKKLLAQNEELKEIINSCNGIIHVDNPSTIIEEDSEDSEGEKEEKQKEVTRNEKDRKESRERLLDHLVENCLEIYKLKEWDSIFQMVENYNKKKEQIEQSNSSNKEKELKQAKSDVTKEINQGIKASVGVEIPGLPVGLTAAIEYTKQTINW